MSIILHAHSWCSLLEGVSSPRALLERAAACGYTALALTDTNNLYGAVTFTEQARQHGIRPLLGACLRLRRSRCVALIADCTGYRSLCRVLSRLHLDDQPQPCPLAALLNDNHEGLHVLVDDLVDLERAHADPELFSDEQERFGRHLARHANGFDLFLTLQLDRHDASFTVYLNSESRAASFTAATTSFVSAAKCA